MGRPGATPTTLQGRARAPALAQGLLVLFLVAVVLALGVTVAATPPSVRLLATSLVLPVVVATVVLLLLERRGHRWAFVGAAALGVVGIALRLAVSTQPQLEVGGGLPLPVTVVYLALGALLVATSLWAATTWP